MSRLRLNACSNYDDVFLRHAAIFGKLGENKIKEDVELFLIYEICHLLMYELLYSRGDYNYTGIKLIDALDWQGSVDIGPKNPA